MNYYLLTFNEDWADEHNVPALACFNEEDYQKWLIAPKGKENKKYDEQFAKFLEAKQEVEKNRKVLRDNNLERVRFDEYPEEFKYLAKAKTYISDRDMPVKGKSFLSAYLGNSGEGFEENFNDCLTGQDFIENGYVRVTKVDETFYNTFKQANLSNLSLCNVFDMELDDYYDEDEEE